MENTLTSILRSGKGKAYFLNVEQALFKALDIHARDPGSIVRTIMLAGVMNSYVEGSASSIGLCGQTVRNNLKGQDPDALINLNEQTITRIKDAGAFSRPLTLAMDWHDVMYYGDPKAHGVKGTQPKKGTHWAYQYGSISIVTGRYGLTLAITPINKGEKTVEHVKRLLDHVFHLGFKVGLLLLDAGYFSADVINYLNSAGIKFIMRMPDVGKIKAGDDVMYTTDAHNKRKGKRATFRVVALNGRDRVGHMELFIFATNVGLRPARIRKLFRKRWGIETSYRMINMFLPKTTSKAYSVRRLYFYLAVLMYNIWTAINRDEEERPIVERIRLTIIVAVILQNIYVIDDAG